MDNLTMEHEPNQVATIREKSEQPLFPERGPVAVNRINMGLVPIQSFADMIAMATWMAKSPILPAAIKFGDDQEATIANCLQIVDRALSAGVSPFVYAQESFVIKGKLGISGKLAASIINARAGLKFPLDHTYFMEGANLRCTVGGTFADKRGRKEKTLQIEKVRTPNPNWDRDPENQLLYATWTAWGRAYCPHLMVGVMTEHDAEIELPGVVVVEPSNLSEVRGGLPGVAAGDSANGKAPQLQQLAEGEENPYGVGRTETIPAKPDLNPAEPCDFFLGKELAASFEMFFTVMGLDHSPDAMKARHWQQSQILAKRGFSCIEAMNNYDAAMLRADLEKLIEQKRSGALGESGGTRGGEVRSTPEQTPGTFQAGS